MASSPVGLRSRGFAAFVTTQFLGAFNDNAFRFSLLFFLQATVADAAQRGRWELAAQLLFALPFVVFAAWAGVVADRWSKTSLIRVWKLAELLIMALGVVAFLNQSTFGLMLVLLLMSVQSAFFGPCKYGFLAERVAPAELGRANGVVQMFTYAAVVGGQLTAGLVSEGSPGDPGWAALAFVVFAGLGLLSSMSVPSTPAARPDEPLRLNVWAELRASYRVVSADPTLRYVMLGVGHFFLLAALLQIRLVAFGIEELGLGEAGAAALIATAVCGIGAGSLLAGRWSVGRVELGLVPVGALAMSTFLLLLSGTEAWPLPLGLSFFTNGLWWPFLMTLLVGIAGGLYIVPLWALLQLHAPEGEKGRYLAFANLVSFLGVGASGLVLWLPAELGLGLRAQLFVVGLVSLAGSLVALKLLPYACVRLIGWLLTHSLYRIRVRDLERLPSKGGALLLANHVSWVDALILQAVSARKLHFLMYRPYYEWWPLRWLFKLVGAIPVDAADDKDAINASLSRAGQLVEDGRLVVIFPEGSVTRLGHMLPFRNGYQRILDGRDLPLIPVHLGGLWGSLFSHERGRLLFKRPRVIPYPVSVSVGEALPSDSSPATVRAALRGLSAEAWEERTRERLPVHLALLREQRRSFAQRLFPQRGRASSAALLAARARRLALALERVLPAGESVGLALRDPLAQLTAQLALLEIGRVPLLLDPRAPRVERLKSASDAGAVACLDDDAQTDTSLPLTCLDWSSLNGALSRGEVRRQALFDALLPWFWLRRRVRASRSADAPAFRVLSESDGAPLAVSHAQLHAQLEGLQQVLGASDKNGIVGLLPLHSSYGQLATFWFPLLGGLRVGWSDQPGDRRSLGRLLRRARLDALPASPELLATLLEHARPDTLGGLRYVPCGLSSLTPELHDAFYDRFGLEPVPCWTAPLVGGFVSINTLDVRAHGVHQRGTRRGTFGHPLPGVSLIAVDGDDTELPAGQEGRLAVRAPGLRAALESRGGSWRGWCLAASGPYVLTDRRGAVDADGFVLPPKSSTAQLSD